MQGSTTEAGKIALADKSLLFLIKILSGVQKRPKYPHLNEIRGSTKNFLSKTLTKIEDNAPD
jgi:hypothetical protein